jgi:hypothetical protein
VELVTSGAAFERFRAAAQKRSSAEAEASRDRNAAGRGGRDADEETDDPRKRMSFRFLRRAFLAARLDGLVASADAAVEAARAVAQDRDPADPNGKPRRAINRAPEDVQEAYRVAVAAARDARVRRRDETPEGVRFSFPKRTGVCSSGWFRDSLKKGKERRASLRARRARRSVRSRRPRARARKSVG